VPILVVFSIEKKSSHGGDEAGVVPYGVPNRANFSYEKFGRLLP